jgi:hypothetical protein
MATLVFVVLQVIVFLLVLGTMSIFTHMLGNSIRKEGGMRRKYKTLVDGCLQCCNAKILQEKPIFISVGGSCVEPNGITKKYAFKMQHRLGNTFQMEIFIKYVEKVGNSRQKTIKRWHFNQPMNQEHMLECMSEYLERLKK